MIPETVTMLSEMGGDLLVWVIKLCHLTAEISPRQEVQTRNAAVSKPHKTPYNHGRVSAQAKLLVTTLSTGHSLEISCCLICVVQSHTPRNLLC